MNIILFESMPQNKRIPANDPRAEHIRKVLRLGISDSFKLGLVNGPSGMATITNFHGKDIVFTWEPQEDAVPLHPVTLVVAQVRPICMKRILRESVSLGVRELVVAGSDTGERSYREAKLWSTGEYRKYLLDGAMQSGSTGMPMFKLIPSVDVFLQEPGTWKTKLVLDPVVDSEPLSTLDLIKDPVVIAIGPERGWSERERKLFTQHGYRFLSIGGRILRTETACSAALAILLGRMNLL